MIEDPGSLDITAVRQQLAEEQTDNRETRVGLLAEGMRQRADAKLLVESEGWIPPPNHGSVAKQLATPLPPVQYVVDKLAPVGSRIALLAQWKAGKTTLALNLCVAAVSNEAFLGQYKINMPLNTGITYTNFEVGREQILRWVQDMGADRYPKARRFILDTWQGYRMPLPSVHVEQYMVDKLKKSRSSVWIIDTFGSAFEGEENSNSEIAAWTKAVDRIAVGAKLSMVVIVIHTGTGSDLRARGATKLMDWPTAFWSWQHGGENQDLPPDNLRYIRAFGRDVDTGNEPLTVDYDVVAKRLFVKEGGMTKSQAGKETKSRKVYDVVASLFAKTGKPCNMGAIFTELGVAQQSKQSHLWRQAIDYCIGEGWIEQETAGNAKLHKPGKSAPGATVLKGKWKVKGGTEGANDDAVDGVLDDAE